MSTPIKIYDEEKEYPWKRVWDVEKFDNLNLADERFFAIVMQGLLSFLNRKVVLKGKPIPHYIQSTGNEYLYVEKNGYEYSMNQTSGETTVYQKVPRCIVNMGNISIVKDELTAPYSRGYYERICDGELKSFSSEMRRLPLSINVNLKYSLSDFNESIVLVEEIMNNLVWVQYFAIQFLGNKIDCSLEFPDSFDIGFNKIDFENTSKNKTIEFDLKLRTNYPQINARTEIQADKVISKFKVNVNPHDSTCGNFEKLQLDDDNSSRIYE